jgi:hypothetical protein
MEELVWCRGRMPFTVDSAAAGAALVRAAWQIESWEELCQRTPAGRQFLMSREWRGQVVAIRAEAELAKAAVRAQPWWRRALDKIL